MSDAKPRRGDWMSTATGRKFWPLDPRADEVHIEDVANALSRICRYNGHCAWHYSVAQHSVYVSYRVPPGMELIGLLHDATEAYCADVPRPLKRWLSNYAEIETGIWLAIAQRFGLPHAINDEVHKADNAVLVAEMQQLLVHDPDWRLPNVEPARVRIAPWTPDQARSAFMRRFEELTNGVAPPVANDGSKWGNSKFGATNGVSSTATFTEANDPAHPDYVAAQAAESVYLADHAPAVGVQPTARAFEILDNAESKLDALCRTETNPNALALVKLVYDNLSELRTEISALGVIETSAEAHRKGNGHE